MKYEITGSDVTEMVPINGVIHVAGIIKSPTQLIRINWEVDCSLVDVLMCCIKTTTNKKLPGETICRADYGQYEIDCLVQSGRKILSVELY